MTRLPSYKRRKRYLDVGEELLILKLTYYRRLKEAETLDSRAPLSEPSSPEISDDTNICGDLESEDEKEPIDSDSSQDA